MLADSRKKELSSNMEISKITSIIFSFFFCSVFLFGSFSPFFFGGMMADELDFPANCARLLILPSNPLVLASRKVVMHFTLQQYSHVLIERLFL